MTRGILVLLVATTGLAAQQPPDGKDRVFQDSLLDRLTGSWTMSGEVHGRPATLSLRAQWVLNHQFLELEMRDVKDPPAYEAAVYVGFDNASDRYVAHWLDDFGGRWSETLGYGRRQGAAITFVFEYPDGPFHTTFTCDRSGAQWSVLMQDRAPDGAWREFAHYAVIHR